MYFFNQWFHLYIWCWIKLFMFFRLSTDVVYDMRGSQKSCCLFWLNTVLSMTHITKLCLLFSVYGKKKILKIYSLVAVLNFYLQTLGKLMSGRKTFIKMVTNVFWCFNPETSKMQKNFLRYYYFSAFENFILKHQNVFWSLRALETIQGQKKIWF